MGGGQKYQRSGRLSRSIPIVGFLIVGQGKRETLSGPPLQGLMVRGKKKKIQCHLLKAVRQNLLRTVTTGPLEFHRREIRLNSE